MHPVSIPTFRAPATHHPPPTIPPPTIHYPPSTIHTSQVKKQADDLNALDFESDLLNKSLAMTMTEDFDDEFGAPPDFGDDGMFGDDGWKDESNQLLQGLGYDEMQSADQMNGGIGMGGGGFGGDEETF